MADWQINTTEDYECITADKVDVDHEGQLRFYDIKDGVDAYQGTIVAIFSKSHWLSVQPVRDPRDE